MRYIRYLCIAIFAIALIAVALANRSMVTIQLLPDELVSELSFAANPSVDLPLFVVIFLGIVIGLMVGFVWEWFREHGIRVEARQKSREARRLERENKRLKAQKAENQGDDVLALLDDAR